MKFLFNLFLLFPFLVFSQSEVKIEYWDNGKILSQVHYKNGVRDGSCRYYFKNGTMMSEGFYKDGKMSGYWHYFYENGNIYQKGNYDHRSNSSYSFKTGKWTLYYENGTIYSESRFILGNSSTIFYNLDGSIKSNIIFGC